MKINKLNKFFVIIIVFLFIGTSFVSGSVNLIVDNQIKSNISQEQRLGLKDIFFDLKMSILIKLALYPSLSACIRPFA